MKKHSKERVKYIIDQNKKIKEIIMPWKEFTQLIEDMHDVKVVLERKDEELLSLDAIKKTLYV
ncbi:hypothetical protein [Pampinifervens florentissimum]|uniref:hypothetical protein n=1 Tax=Pampinifervens florentissimum TaxID=1632019 RepID=UPI0013B48AC9|nr:hypothetical protein [Hydrogenobacter sp. T-8]QID34104.1 hypothetical protein G3M65_10095 [Hydrogenobacter sp. T-8]